jgi:PAS domain S-box-containing protein
MGAPNDVIPAPAAARRSGRRAPPSTPEAYFRSLVENARDVIHVVNADRTTRYVTPSIARLLGYAPEELVGRNPLDLVHPDDREPALELLRRARLAPGAGQPLEVRVRHRDGSWPSSTGWAATSWTTPWCRAWW